MYQKELGAVEKQMVTLSVRLIFNSEAFGDDRLVTFRIDGNI